MNLEVNRQVNKWKLGPSAQGGLLYRSENGQTSVACIHLWVMHPMQEKEHWQKRNLGVEVS